MERKLLPLSDLEVRSDDQIPMAAEGVVSQGSRENLQIILWQILLAWPAFLVLETQKMPFWWRGVDDDRNLRALAIAFAFHLRRRIAVLNRILPAL